MELRLSERTLLGLGSTPPKIADTKTNNIADPNTTLEADGSKKGRKADWTCNEWVIFHKTIVQWFKEGRFASRIKYSDEDTKRLSNQVFRQHWDRASWTLTRCGFNSDFVAYFRSVGLADIFNALQKTVDATKSKAAAVADSVSDTAVNVVDKTGKVINNVGGGIANITGAAKYVLPIALGGAVLFLGTYAYKNYIKGDSRLDVKTPYGSAKI